MLADYPVACCGIACSNAAAFKVAARWSDGTTRELKTYSLACADCLPALFAAAREKQRRCRKAAGETLGKPEVYERTNPHDPRSLARRADLEPA